MPQVPRSSPQIQNEASAHVSCGGWSIRGGPSARLPGRRAAGAYGSRQFEEMRAKCIGQDLSWDVPASKWEAVLQDVRAGKPNRVLPSPAVRVAVQLCHRELECEAKPAM